jgi:hypothetical protein
VWADEIFIAIENIAMGAVIVRFTNTLFIDTESLLWTILTL